MFGKQSKTTTKMKKFTTPQTKVVIKQLIHQLNGNNGIDWRLTNRELNTLLNTDCVSFQTIEDGGITIPMGLDLEKLICFEQGSELIARIECQ